MSYLCKFWVKNMRELQPDMFIHKKRAKFQVEFPGNQIQHPIRYDILHLWISFFHLVGFIRSHVKGRDWNYVPTT